MSLVTRASGRLVVAVAVAVAVCLAPVVLLGTDAAAQAAGVRLVASCTATELLDVGIRTFRVDNSSGANAAIRLVNLNSGAALEGTAPPGSSFWDVQGVNGRANTTELWVSDVFVESKGSLNRTCGSLVGNANCDPSTGTVAVTWTLTSFNGAPSTITANTGGLTFTPNPLPTGGLGGTQSVATETVVGAAASIERTLTLTVDLGSGRVTSPSATITVPPCEGPPSEPISFTLTKTANVDTANVGDTITYTYTATNLSSFGVESRGLVDDRLGVVFAPPTEHFMVAPGQTISRTATYVVQPSDAGTTIENNAVGTGLNPTTGESVQGVATARVVVALPPEVPVTTPVTAAPPPPGPPQAPAPLETVAPATTAGSNGSTTTTAGTTTPTTVPSTSTPSPGQPTTTVAPSGALPVTGSSPLSLLVAAGLFSGGLVSLRASRGLGRGSSRRG